MRWFALHHCEATGEKQAMGHFCDRRGSLVAVSGDYRILSGGTAYITDLGMTGDYDSVVGMDRRSKRTHQTFCDWHIFGSFRGGWRRRYNVCCRRRDVETDAPLQPAQNLDPHRLMTLKLDLRSHAWRITPRQTRRRPSDAYRLTTARVLRCEPLL